MSMTRLYEDWAIVAEIDPQTLGNATILSGEINMSLWQEIVMIVLTGDCAANGTIDAGFQGASASGGSYAALTGYAITQRASSATANDNKQFIVRAGSPKLHTLGKPFIKGFITGSGASIGPVAALILGRPRYGGPTDFDVTSVTEVVDP
jgi:hypothetical protein